MIFLICNYPFKMFDSVILSFFPFLLSFVGTFLLSNVFVSYYNNLKLEGTIKSRLTRKRISQGAGSIVIFCGGSLSLCFVVVMGFVPSPLFLQVLFLGALLVVIGFRANVSALKAKGVFLFQLTFAILLVVLLQTHFLNLSGIIEFTLAVVFSIGCVYLISALNLLEKTSILFSIAVTLFGAILGIYTNDLILSTANFSVMGSLLAFTFFNFSESKNIELGLSGEMLIGLSMATQGLYLFGNDTSAYFNFLPLAFILFIYPVCDALQYFGCIAINKLFGKNIKVRQIHNYF